VLPVISHFRKQHPVNFRLPYRRESNIANKKFIPNRNGTILLEIELAPTLFIWSKAVVSINTAFLSYLNIVKLYGLLGQLAQKKLVRPPDFGILLMLGQ